MIDPQLVGKIIDPRREHLAAVPPARAQQFVGHGCSAVPRHDVGQHDLIARQVVYARQHPEHAIRRLVVCRDALSITGADLQALPRCGDARIEKALAILLCLHHRRPQRRAIQIAIGQTPGLRAGRGIRREPEEHCEQHKCEPDLDQAFHCHPPERLV